MPTRDSVTIEGIYIADQPGTFVSRQVSEVPLEFGGIQGDRHFGMTAFADVRQPMYPRGTEILNKRQISILAVEELERIAKNMGIRSIQPQWIGANLLLRGLPELTNLPVRTRFLFPGGAGLMNEGENKPCIQSGNEVLRSKGDDEEPVQSFVKSALGRRGIVCSVERPGMIYEQDEIEVVYP